MTTSCRLDEYKRKETQKDFSVTHHKAQTTKEIAYAENSRNSIFMNYDNIKKSTMCKNCLNNIYLPYNS